MGLNDKIIGHLGTPHQILKPEEPKKWKRFLIWITPWLKKKAMKADEYADAELSMKVAQAEKMKAEAQRTQMETAKLALEMEKEKLEIWEKRLDIDKKQNDLAKQNLIDITPSELDEFKRGIEEKIDRLSILYGGRLLDFEVVGGSEDIPNKMDEQSKAKSDDFDPQDEF